MGIVSMFSNACNVHWIVFKLQVLVLCLFYAVVYYGLCCRPVSPRILFFLVLKNFVRSRGIVSGGEECCVWGRLRLHSAGDGKMGGGGIEYLKLRNCCSVLNCK